MGYANRSRNHNTVSSIIADELKKKKKKSCIL